METNAVETAAQEELDIEAFAKEHPDRPRAEACA